MDKNTAKMEEIVTLSQHLKRSGVEMDLRRLITSFAFVALDAQHEFPKYLRGRIIWLR